MRVVAALALMTIVGCAVATTPPYYCGGPHTIPPLTDAPAGAKLVQAQVFIRHGDRTMGGPADCWQNDNTVFDCKISQLQKSVDVESNGTVSVPRAYDLSFDPNREYLAGNCGLGELTSLGYNMQVQQGGNLRSAYVEEGATSFLPATFAGNVDDFFLRSDDSARTIKSGQALFDGLYPPPAGATQEVAWNTMDSSHENIVANANNCPALGPMQTASYSSPAIVALGKQNKAAFLKLAKELGVPATKFSILSLQDCAITHICHDHAVPTAVSDNMDYILKTSVEFVQTLFEYKNITRFGIGPLVKEFWGYMENVMDGRDDYKFRLYSGHDLGPIMPLLIAYGVFDNEWPWYASLISMELYEVGDSWAVRMVYNDKVMHIPGCTSTLCDIDEFRTVTEAIIPTAAECALPETKPDVDAFAAMELNQPQHEGVRWLEETLLAASRMF